ncbi:MAG: hypothetical protein ACRDQ2_07070 [Gaiellales bacterium]
MQKRKSVATFLSFALGALAALTIAGPAAIQLTSADEEPVLETTEETLEVTADPCATPTPAATPTPEATATPEATPSPEATPTPAPSPTTLECEEADDDGDDDADATEESEDGTTTSFHENHGRAVSTAAHCPLKGRAHGELVRSIARDKDATVEEAQAACDAALEAAAASEASSDASPGHGKGHGNGKWAREDDETDVAEDFDDDDSEASLDSGDGGEESTKGGPPSWAGHKDK